MDELQALLGDSYKEGMTVEEIGEFFKGKKFADLSTGNYVDKNKYTNEINNLNNQLSQTQKELNDKLTDDEKNTKAYNDLVKQNEQLQKQLADNTISGNKNTVTSIMAEARDTLSINATDEEFVGFVANITTEDANKSMSIANYVAKLVKDSYEKGKQDATKDSMGEFGKGKGKQGDGDDDKIGTIGKRLADANKNNGENNYDYFNKK